MRALGRTLVSLGVIGAATAGTVLLLPGATPPAAAAGLTPYASCDQLLAHYRAELRESATPYGFGDSYGFALEGDVRVGAPMSAPQAATAGAARDGAATAVGPGSTGTNVQEKGVDEPDSTKLAGGLLVTVAEGVLRVLRAGADPQLLSTTTVLPRDRGYGAELLLAGDRALVLQGGWRPDPRQGQAGDSRFGYYGGGGDPITTAVLLDLRDPAAPKVLERLELDGSYLSARLADGRVRLVTRSTPRPDTTYPKGRGEKAEQDAALRANRRAAEQITLSEVLPRAVRTGPDGRTRSDSRAVDCEGISRAEDPRGSSTLLVTTLDPAKDLVALDATGVTSDGDLVYASAERLYVATSRWGTAPQPADDTASSTVAPVDEGVTTELHAFDTATADTRYVGTGSVPGYVMGRWALSSYEGRLRVAVTSSPPWQGRETSESSLHVLEESAGELVTVGKVGGMGKGERIQAVRYFGDLATVVTFRQTDPLYVLDLADPADPRILGELKIPGFSTYLHPLGGDLLLGVGMDADEKTGQTTGVQLSTFDLSDRTKPRQVDRLSLGQGYSQALGESRAFGYDPVRRHALLPFTPYTSDVGPSGKVASQPAASALGIRISADGQLTEAGRLELAPGFQPDRVMHDADHVYAVNATGLATGDGDDLRRTSSLSWK